MSREPTLDVDVPAARAAFTAIGGAAIASDFEPTAACGDDLFTAAFATVMASMKEAEQKDEAVVVAAERAAEELGLLNLRNYEGQDLINRSDLSTTGVLA